MPLVSCADLRNRLSAPDVVIVDCRHELRAPDAGVQAYRSGHIPGACHADLDRDLARTPKPSEGRHPLPAVDSFVATVRALGISNESQVVVYDDCSGAMAARLWWMLRWLGHDSVSVLDGGIKAWLAAGLPLEREVRKNAEGTFTPAIVHDDWLITTVQLVDSLEQDTVILLDARATERFDGLVEPIDPVAGHVPGATSLPFSTLLDEHGLFLKPQELRQRLAVVIGSQSSRDVVTMCGSGVTACHLLLGVHVAGLEEGRLYIGSWSEWIRNPARPIARRTAS